MVVKSILAVCNPTSTKQVCVILNNFRFKDDLKDRVTIRERQRQKKKFFPPIDSLPKWLQCLGLGQELQSLGARCFI